MKTTRKHLPFWFFLLVWAWKSSSLVQAQSDTTYTGNITVRTQASVNALRNTLAGKTRINGNLTIGYIFSRGYFTQSNITDLSPLGNIVRITGNLRIEQNGSLDSLTDLNTLQSIGSFEVYSNRELTDVGYFSSLQSIGGDFRVSGNRELTDVGYFSSLQSIGGDFRVSGNRELTDVGYFSSLQSIGGDFRVSGNRELTDLRDFPSLQSIGGYFYVDSNYELTDLGDFPVLQSIENCLNGGKDFFGYSNWKKVTISKKNT